MNIYAIKPELIDDMWQQVSPYIQKGLDFANNEMDLDDVHSMIEEGNVVPIVIEEDSEILSVITLELVDKPQKRILGVMTAGGHEMDKWLDQIIDVIDAVAKEQQADSININGRKGWLRKLDKYNYKHVYTVLSKEVH